MRSTTSVSRARTLASIALVALVAACAPGSPEPAEPVASTSSDVYGGFPVASPGADEVVLTLVGSSTVELTMGELEALATAEVTFVEPFVKAEQTFQVIRLADVLALAGIARGDRVDTIALNDYRFQDDVDGLLDAGALLAVGRSGGPIPMSEGGPIRLVFDVDSPYHEFLDAWNWSLRSIVVVAGP
jgi:hypothetical protein